MKALLLLIASVSLAASLEDLKLTSIEGTQEKRYIPVSFDPIIIIGNDVALSNGEKERQ
jgi:hypothetical protein